ncbi:uncharacterized protein CANTADRAFT_212599 [Suhomyces tanzawaensis NRRL Y-17324]|uniref:Succinate dehydrogenase assembly factor 4, mitochondrial n=1 Tax=Suhomyces tanzawaensis NRRL Y-17324 TaxID=984487 RepID=A0A1E4SJQ9_9ASCO|nr:uncharacterized protein CANTADRAFT_212599 [Suhomyces tanzawaensis NRRL Y-17324]ODV79743.1 hypothetical protein CANTADRAFT_212599 [Suhomyces tanzawaensis NRRL Y-17324]
MLSHIVKNVRPVVLRPFAPRLVAIRLYANFNEYTPGPPKLPEEEQKEFEKLQKIANSQIAIEEYNEQLEQKGGDFTPKEFEPSATDIGTFALFKTIPEFEGDVNPKTGERGGPKQDPLKHGDEWSYNGRVIDF